MNDRPPEGGGGGTHSHDRSELSTKRARERRGRGEKRSDHRGRGDSPRHDAASRCWPGRREGKSRVISSSLAFSSIPAFRDDGESEERKEGRGAVCGAFSPANV